MTFALLAPKNLPGASDFESLGHGLLGFGLSGCSCHRLADDSDEITIGNNDFQGLFHERFPGYADQAGQVEMPENKLVARGAVF